MTTATLERPRIDTKAEMQRWYPTVKRYRGDDKANAFYFCRTKARTTWQCPEGERWRFPLSCNQPGCITCMPDSLRRDWHKYAGRLRGPLKAIKVRHGGSDDFTKLRKDCQQWRMRNKINNGLHYVVYDWNSGEIFPEAVYLMVLPEYEAIPESTPAFPVETVSTEFTNSDGREWLVSELVREIAGAGDQADMLSVMNAKHRLQAFGIEKDSWRETPAAESAAEKSDMVSVTTESPSNSTEDEAAYSNRNHVSGGPKKRVLCPIHGLEMEDLHFGGPLEDYTYDEKAKAYVSYPPFPMYNGRQ